MDNEMKDIEEDFHIRIRPNMDNGKWDGSIDVAIRTGKDNSLDETDFSDMMHLCHVIVASIPVMEEDDYVQNALLDYVDNYFKYEEEQDDPIIDRDGNIIKLDFDTKTKGNA